MNKTYRSMRREPLYSAAALNVRTMRDVKAFQIANDRHDAEHPDQRKSFERYLEDAYESLEAA